MGQKLDSLRPVWLQILDFNRFIGDTDQRRKLIKELIAQVKTKEIRNVEIKLLLGYLEQKIYYNKRYQS